MNPRSGLFFGERCSEIPNKNKNSQLFHKKSFTKNASQQTLGKFNQKQGKGRRRVGRTGRVKSAKEKKYFSLFI